MSAIQGKVVVVTGGARGIGYATSRKLKSLGCRVAVGDIDLNQLSVAERELGLDLVGHLDVTDSESFRRFLDLVSKRLGPPDVVVNNAGVMPVGPTLDESEEVARRMIDINLHGVITGTKLALELMLAHERGHIVNIASMAGEASVPGIATYCATKAAVIAFTDAVRLEYRASGVDISLVLPTFTNTELIAGTQGPRGFRNAEPDQIAEAIAELLVTPRPRVYVTRSMGVLLKAQRFMPRSYAEGLARHLGGDRMFLGGVDAQARRAYEDRVRGS